MVRITPETVDWAVVLANVSGGCLIVTEARLDFDGLSLVSHNDVALLCTNEILERTNIRVVLK